MFLLFLKHRSVLKSVKVGNSVKLAVIPKINKEFLMIDYLPKKSNRI